MEEQRIDIELGRDPKRMGGKLKNVMDNIKKDWCKILSMFVTGLTVMQPYHTAIAGSRFGIRRFGVPEELSSIYVSKFHTSMHTLNIFGVVTVNVYMWFFGLKRLRFNPLLSVFTNLLVALAHVGLVVTYTLKSPKDLTWYYWFSTASAFIYGLNQALVASVGVEYMSYFICGLQVSGIGVTIFHSLFLSLCKLFSSVNVDYWIIATQLTLCTIVAIASLLLWNMSFGQGDLGRMLRGQRIEGDNKDAVVSVDPMVGAGLYVPKGHVIDATTGLELLKDPGLRGTGSGSSGLTHNNRTANSRLGHTHTNRSSVERGEEGVRNKHTMARPKHSIFYGIKRAKSPILMSAFSMSFAFFFYPSVAPYKLAELGDAHKIDLSVLVAAALPTIAVCVICILDIGPNKSWKDDNKSWHNYWYLAIPYLFTCVSFVVAMHYPEVKYAKVVKNPVALAFLVDLMIACYSLLKSVGYSGAGMQEDVRNGTISTFNMMFSFLFLFTGVFWGSGYIKLYNRYAKEDWPTAGMSSLKSFIFWAKYSFHLGFGNFTKILTNDLMRDIVSTPQ